MACMCGDTACWSCGPAQGAGPVFEECPVCGGVNFDEETGDLFDEDHQTCGAADCIAKAVEMERQQVEADRAADDAEAKWLAEMELMDARGEVP